MKEIGLRFGSANHLVGTLTLPDSNAEYGLILLSAGLLHRIGPHRLHVKFARLAAERGIAALRFDMPGVGDSATPPGRESYETQILRAATEAMNLLADKAGTSRFIVAGLCSGADNGYLVARRDPRIKALFMLEPYFFPNRLSSPLRMTRRLREYGLRPAASRLWQVLREGEFFRGRQGNVDGRVRPPAGEFSEGLKELADRGVHMRLLYAAISMGQYDLRQHRRRIFGNLAQSPFFRIEALAHSDHLFTQLAAKEAVNQRFLDLLRTVTAGGSQRTEAEPA